MEFLSTLKPLIILVVALIPAPFLGRWLAKVYRGERHLLSFLAPLERIAYRATGIDAERDMDWKEYLGALLVFNAAGIAVLLLILMTQAWLPFNPEKLPNLSWHLAFNTAISFVTNTNWQSYSGESTMSHLSQAIGLTTWNFASAATGAAVALALARAFAPRPKMVGLFDLFDRFAIRSQKGEVEALERHRRLAPVVPNSLGNFWQDLIRTTVYVLLPLSLVLAMLLVSQGVPQTLAPYAKATTLEGKQVAIPLGPAASQIAIKQLGSNGGGYFGVNSAHPFENPTPFSNFLELVFILLLPAAFPFLFGELVGKRRQGWAIFGAMLVLFLAGIAIALPAEMAPNPALGGLPSLEGKETRFGIAETATWAVATTAVSNGSINGMHGSASPLLVLVAMVNMVLGEVVFGGVGAGLYGMLLFVVLSVFIAGLMVGRSPEFLGRKIEAREVQFAMLGVIAPSFVILVFTAIALVLPAGHASILNQGPRGFSEILYAFSSAAANNGSALAGLGANNPFWNVMLGLGMLIGRYCVIVPALAIAGSASLKRPVPEGAGTLRTDSLSFSLLLAAVVIIVGGLTFFPALAIGPVVEQLMAQAGRLF